MGGMQLSKDINYTLFFVGAFLTQKPAIRMSLFEKVKKTNCIYSLCVNSSRKMFQ